MPMVSDLPDADPLVFAVDVTTWSRAFGAPVLGDRNRNGGLPAGLLVRP